MFPATVLVVNNLLTAAIGNYHTHLCAYTEAEDNVEGELLLPTDVLKSGQVRGPVVNLPCSRTC